MGDYAAARPLLHECLALYRTLRTHRRFLYVLFHYLCMAVREQDFERAAMIWGFEEAFRESTGIPRPPQIGERYQAEEDAARLHLGAERFVSQAARGAQMPEEEMIAFLLNG